MLELSGFRQRKSALKMHVRAIETIKEVSSQQEASRT
jgi:hypothetical protein